jgi:hypothetical protein
MISAWNWRVRFYDFREASYFQRGPATSCTMCSVPGPVRALRELHRVLRPNSRLLMFEHVRSRQCPWGWTLTS